jgi:hypothetical protein
MDVPKANPPQLWQAIASDSTDDGEKMNLALIDDFVCGECGSDAIIARCSVHGQQEIVAIQSHKARCNEWDFERGEDCRERLTLTCDECGSEEVEL